MIGPDIDKSAVPPDIINAIRIGPRHVGTGKIVPLYLLRLFRRKPLLASIMVITNEFFLLGIHRDHGIAVRQPSFPRSIDVAELRVTVWMIPVPPPSCDCSAGCSGGGGESARPWHG